MPAPYLKLYKMNSDGTADTTTELDITQYIADGGLTIEHEDLDTEKSGRNPDTGDMERVRIAHKHTLTVKLRRVDTSVLHSIFNIVIPQPRNVQNTNPFFIARFFNPCQNGDAEKTVYCSTINYGAQRYDRSADKVVFDGATFKIIKK